MDHSELHGSFPGVHTGVTPIVGCLALYLLHTRRTGSIGATNRHQYPCMDAQKD